MKRRIELLLIGLIVIGAALLRIIFWQPDIYGSDFFYHYTVTEQAIANGKLSNDNNLAMCYEGVKQGHPHGFYFLPYIGGKILGLDNAFIILPVLLGLISLILTYMLLKKLFSKRVAMVALFFLAISVGHISKSFPFSWRGENLIYPLLLGALLTLYTALFEKKKIYAIISGILSGASIWFWNGYPLLVLICLGTILLTIAWKWIKKEKDMLECILIGMLSMVTQAIVLIFLSRTIELAGKGLVFGRYYYPIIIIVTIAISGVIYYTQKKRSIKPLIVVFFIMGAATLFFMPYIKQILMGFGSVDSLMGTITPTELQTTKWYQYLFAFHILLITSLLGLYQYIKNFTAQKAFFLGLLLPSLYLIGSASRYIYFASIPILALTGIFLEQRKKVKKKFDIFIFLTIVLMIFMSVYSLYAIPKYLSEGHHVQNKEPYQFLRENTEKNACIIEISDQGATTEFLAKRYYYFHSLGADYTRLKKVHNFLLDEGENNFGIENLYILVSYNDLAKIRFISQNTDVKTEEIGFYRTITYGDEEEINETELTEGLDFMKHVFVNNKLYVNETGKGCAYAGKYDTFYLKDGVCNTTLFKMLTNQTITDFKNVYFKEGYAIYKYEPNAS
ncbi:MAG: glycosyltransferase family 39 protein [Candidatus Woesearchaeota archaeon]|nr:glycosyltransferase family 39 protein [Candidatus Woesearchaeota archaeon]